MTVIALTSAKGAPGVTTTALAMALAWPRKCLLVEADMAGSSSILAGYFHGDVRHDHGLVDLADAQRRGALAEGLHQASLPLGGSDARFIPGLRTSAQAGTMRRLWEPIAAAVRGLERAGTDVIVDAGRVSTAGSPMPLLREADLTLLVTRSTMPAIAGARALVTVLRDDLADRGSGEDALVGMMVGEGQPFSRREAASVLRLEFPLTIAWDPVNAEVLALGKDGGKRWQGSRFVRSVHACTSHLEQLVQARRSKLAPGALRDEQEVAR